MKRRILYVLMLLFAFIPRAYATSPVSFQSDYAAIDHAAQSCFIVDIIGEDQSVLGTGSGFVAFDEHYFITNHHVILNAIELQIYSDQYKNTHTLTEVVATNEDLDIAILAFPEGKQYEPLPLAPDFQLFRGQPVTAIGSPQGVLNTVSFGNISSLQTDNHVVRDIQFTAPTSSGSSGGALFNDEGNIIGLIYAVHKYGENMNYAIPIQYVIDLYNSAKKPVSLKYFNFREQFIIAPQNVTAEMDGKKVKITWDTVETGISYQVFRVSANGSERSIGKRYINEEKSSGVLWDTKPEYGETVSYYVIAENDVKRSDKSEPASIHIPPKPTPTPTKEPTPSPTPSPTPEPTPLPTLPEGLAEQYSPGVSGSDILQIKYRMLELGYYKPNSKLGNAYNDIMKERIMLFQQENNLKATGILDNNTLLTLFSDAAIPTSVFSPTPKPTAKPTPKKTAEPRITLQIPDNAYGQWHYNRNDLAFRLQVKNVSTTKTVSSYEIYLYPTDARGNRLLKPNEVYVLNCNTNVLPGKTVYSDYVYMDNADDIRYVYAAIHKVKYDNGKIEEVSILPSYYSQWTID